MALDKECVPRVLPHPGFRHSSSVVFIVGLPGAGKSYVRRKLEGEYAALADFLVKRLPILEQKWQSHRHALRGPGL